MRNSLPTLILFALVLMAPSSPSVAPLSVVQDGMRLLLSAHGAQTVSRLDGGRTGYYYDLGERAGELRPRARRVVMLGLGGGETLRAARRSLPKASLVGVDIDPRVVHAAVTEFHVEDFGVVAEVGDGLEYVKRLRGVDVLIDDMFLDDTMVLSERFFVDCRKALAPKGLFMVNVYPADRVIGIAVELRQAGFRVLEQHEVKGSTVVFAER
jgi:spermidine synthase